ncbi:hypothetical protein ACIBCS_36565 [Streptomyces phaeochromogenes]|uniref:hypothetical protein n=1 Tax=Streptomyces phaeochromogenes TaxID=1923 RepID=UPI0033D4EE75
MDLQGPVKPNTTPQAHGDYGQHAFTIDWENRVATCPRGNTTSSWRRGVSQEGLPVVRMRIPKRIHNVCLMFK